jgi:hypothetical protein
MRSHSTDWLETRRGEVVAELRRLQSEEHAILRVLDERGRLDPSRGLDGESARTVRQKVETARALESLPAISKVAAAGALSAEQLDQVVKFADEASDEGWAQRAPNMTPADLARLARERSTPTVEEGRARHAARHLRTWKDTDRGMLCGRFELPDVMGAKFDATIQKLVEGMRPPRGQPWARWEHRAADALVLMCDAIDVAERIDSPMAAAPPLFVVEVPPSGPVTIAGVPMPDALVEQLRASASVEPLLVDDDGFPTSVGTRSRSLSPKITRSVLRRDGHCRCGTCDLRYGLQVHHLRPRTWGGSDDISNLAAVAGMHHPMLIPNGPYALVGNPNLPDGLQMVHVDDLTPEQARQSRAPPTATQTRRRVTAAPCRCADPTPSRIERHRPVVDAVACARISRCRRVGHGLPSASTVTSACAPRSRRT